MLCFMGRAPQGARGLKFNEHSKNNSAKASRPARGAWVEMNPDPATKTDLTVAPRKGRVG